MHRWIERLLERTRLVKGLRAEVDGLVADRDMWQDLHTEVFEEMRRHIFVPPGASSIREAYDAVVKEYRQTLHVPALSMTPRVTKHTECAPESDTVHVFSTTISPNPRCINLRSLNPHGPVGRRMMAEEMTQKLIAQLHRTLPSEIEKQLETIT